MPSTLEDAADTVFQHRDLVILLRENPYRCDAAQIPDDGIIDPIAVDRFASGDTSVRLSPREVVCVIAQLAASGETDPQIAGRFGRADKRGKKWIQRLRALNRIPAAESQFTEAELASVLTNPSSRAKASGAKLRAAGVIL